MVKMKKAVLTLLMVALIVIVTGCVKIGQNKYKEGTYFVYDDETAYSVVMYVDSSGMIKSLFFDAVYAANCAQRGVLDSTCTITTKQALGDDYNMKAASPIEKEWYEQVNAFADKVIEEQGIDWLEFKYRVMGDDGKYTFTDTKPEGSEEKDKVYTDSVAGVTIVVDNLHRLVNDVLEQAKKE